MRIFPLLLIFIFASNGLSANNPPLSSKVQKCSSDSKSASSHIQSADNNFNAKGYYKDVFMDGGIKLTSRIDLPAARYLNLSIECYYSASAKEGHPLVMTDTLMQRYTMIASANDQNGHLLFPDGEPRFRMIYVNGGKAAGHGKSLGEDGRKRFQQYIDNGGSYVGSCAGAFIASNRTLKDSVPRKTYLNLWKGVTVPTGLTKSQTGMFVEENSPLLEYYDFGGDMYIDSVRHNGGCYADPVHNYPEGTEILLRYDREKPIKEKSIHKQISSWAYKADESSGRIVLIGSHPESIVSGERLELMAAMMRYAMDGNGNPKVKCELQNGVPVEMTKMTSDNDPAHTRIGDRQYHHFKINVPKGTNIMKINLISTDKENPHTLSLYVNRDNFAFNDNCLYKNVALGIDKTITVNKPKAGEYYISVFGEDTVETEVGVYGTYYTGDLDVLNGVPYSISVIYK